MALPSGAKLEKILPGGIAIYDVSDILPTPPHPRANRRPAGTKIVRVFFHHSGAYGEDGYEGAKNSMRFVMFTRDFGSKAYHYWLSIKPDVDANGNMVIYRLAKDEERAWHTGNVCNDNGIGVVWQGNLHPDHDGEPTPEQYKMAEALTNWLLEKHELSLPDGLSFHAEAKKWGAAKNKATCPGPYVQPWVEQRRQQTVQSIEEPKVQAPVPNVVLEVPVEPVTPTTILPVETPAPKKNWFQRATGAWIDNLLGKKK